MRQSTYDNNILSEAIAQAKTLRNIAMCNAKFSLKNFLKEEKLPLAPLVNLDDLDLDSFVDIVLDMHKDDSDDDYDLKGDPYLNCKHKLRKRKTDDELDEHGRFNMYGEVDDVEFEIDDDEDDDDTEEENFSDEAIAERNRKWQNLYGRPYFKTAPAIVSSGTGTTKLSQNERNLLLKHAGLLKENKENRLCKENKDDLIRQRAKITKSDKHLAKQVISDIAIKKKLK